MGIPGTLDLAHTQITRSVLPALVYYLLSSIFGVRCHQYSVYTKNCVSEEKAVNQI